MRRSGEEERRRSGEDSGSLSAPASIFLTASNSEAGQSVEAGHDAAHTIPGMRGVIGRHHFSILIDQYIFYLD